MVNYNFSISIIELIKTDKSLHENAIIIFITKKNKKSDYNHVTEYEDGNLFEFSYSGNIIYNNSNKFMASWWGIDSYFNIEQIQIGDIEIMISTYGSSGLFGSRVRYKFIENNTYTVRRINFRSKPTPIHGPAHKSDLNYSYSRSHFSRLSQAVAKNKLLFVSES